MEYWLYDLSGLFAVIAIAWMLEHLGSWGTPDLQRVVADQIKVSGDTIRGAPLP